MNAAVDFGVVKHFRSVTLLSDASRTGMDRLVDVDLFLDWLARYDLWFKTSVVEGNQLSLMYNRSLSLTAPRLQQDLPHIIRIARAGRELGLGPLVQINIVDAVRHPDQVFELVTQGGLNTLFLDASEPGALEPDACAALVRALAPSGVALILYGAADFWTATGVLTSPELNGASFQLLPLRRRPAAPAPVDLHRKGLKLLPAESKALIPRHIFNPCAHRFQLLVAPNGVIYPCHALIGMVALGHIEDPVDAALFEGALDWKALGACGPSLAPEKEDLEEGNEALPLVCRSHMRQLQTMIEGLPA